MLRTGTCAAAYSCPDGMPTIIMGEAIGLHSSAQSGDDIALVELAAGDKLEQTERRTV